MWPILTPAIDFLKERIGKTGILIVSFFCLGVYAMIEYPKYVVTPEMLNTSTHEVMVSIRLVELRQVRLEQGTLTKEQIDLEDVIYDVQQSGKQPKPRLLNRLSLVKDRLAELSKSEIELTKFLEGKN